MKGNFFFNVFFFQVLRTISLAKKLKSEIGNQEKVINIVVNMAGNATTYPKQSRAELFFIKEFSTSTIIIRNT